MGTNIAEALESILESWGISLSNKYASQQTTGQTWLLPLQIYDGLTFPVLGII